MNVGKTVAESAVEPNFEDNPFGFFGINSGKFGKDPSIKADPEGKSTSVGVAMTCIVLEGRG